MDKRIAIASDHAGYKMKVSIIEILINKGYEVVDFGTDSLKPVDYPDYAHPLAHEVGEGDFLFGITLCGSGNGINMVANKHQKVRAALCWNEEIARLARRHNDANICALPARFIDLSLAKRIIDVFLNSKFSGGRHAKRKAKIPIGK